MSKTLENLGNITDYEIRGEEEIWLGFMEKIARGEKIDWETVSLKKLSLKAY